MGKNVIGILFVGILVLAFLWYVLSPLFLDREVSEDFPTQAGQESGNALEDSSDANDSSAATDEGVVAQEPPLSGVFQDADSFHKTSGEVLIVSDGQEEYVRLENFQTTNGPDLYVYLSNDLEANDYVSLGELKGNIGDQNYILSENTNPEDYEYVLIWCEDFSVLFGYAELS